MEDEPRWETVCTEGCTNGYGTPGHRAYVRRLLVPSGWLYETLDYDHHRSDLAKLRSRIVTFVPKPTMVEVMAADHRVITS